MYYNESILDFEEFGIDNDFYVNHNEALEQFITQEEIYE